MPIITLTTDFGLQDHYVGTMKGVILNINPAAQVADISHAVPSYDLLDGALTISAAYAYFPPGTIHVVVVDPGVGTARRPIVVDAGRHQFIAPDNGVLSLMFEREENVVVRHITVEHYFLRPVSATFHGRDVFAPIAAHLSKGIQSSVLGDVVTDYVRYAIARPKPETDSRITGTILRADKFGNLITNFRPLDLPLLSPPASRRFRMAVGKGEVTSLKSAFAEGAPGEVFAILGSMGYVEIASNRGSAAQLLGAGRGSEVKVTFE